MVSGWYIKKSKAPNTAAFRRWFGSSKVTDDGGRPIAVYHSGTFDENADPIPSIGNEGMHFGTLEAASVRPSMKEVDDFIKSATYELDPDSGRWFWNSAQGMSSYELDEEGFETEAKARADVERLAMEQSDSWQSGGSEDPPVTVAWLRIENPCVVDDQGASWVKAVREARRKGCDGLVYRNRFEDKGSISYVVFDPWQVKSVKNSGSFSLSDLSVLA